MKLNRAEWTILAVAAVFLALMVGRYWGAESARQVLLPSEPAPSQSQAGTESAELVDLNTAGVEELAALPGIGEGRARAIVAWREEHGPFRYIEDIVQVPGIGEGLFAELEGHITVGG